MTELFIHDRAIRIVRDGQEKTAVELADNALRLSHERLAAAVTEAIEACESIDESVTLVVTSFSCYVHSVQTAQRRPTHTMLRYAFEEFLPVDVETLTCDFLLVPGRHIGLGVETSRVKPLLDVLHKRSIPAERITFDVFARPSIDGAAIWVDADHITILAPHRLAMHILRFAAGTTLEQRAAGVRDILSGFDDGEARELAVVSGVVPNDDLYVLAGQIGAEVRPLSRGGAPSESPVNLARDALGPRGTGQVGMQLWRHTAAMTLLACLALSAGFWLHTQRLQSQVLEVQRWERTVWAEIFPNQPVPGAIGLRFASERRRLEALKTADRPAKSRPDALRLLHNVVAALPAESRIDLQELRIENGDVILRGRTTDHQQAERIGQALHALESVDCDPVRTDRSRDAGVQFFLHAKPPAEAKPATVAKGTSDG